MIQLPRVPSRLRQGFSLVEVTLALGVVGAAFIPLLALLSVGFATLKESNADVKAALIAQRVLASAQMAPFDALSGATLYLDFEGREVASREAVIQARLNVSATNFLNSTNLRRVSVTLNGTAFQNQARVFSATVANLGD